MARYESWIMKVLIYIYGGLLAGMEHTLARYESWIMKVLIWRPVSWRGTYPAWPGMSPG
jgi:hypothetical protein